MKTWDEINVDKILPLEDFMTLFSQLPLTEEEKTDLTGYHQIYEAFVKADVTPKDAWVCTRNIFAVKNQQIGDRIKANQTTLKIVK